MEQKKADTDRLHDKGPWTGPPHPHAPSHWLGFGAGLWRNPASSRHSNVKPAIAGSLSRSLFSENRPQCLRLHNLRKLGH